MSLPGCHRDTKPPYATPRPNGSVSVSSTFLKPLTQATLIPSGQTARASKNRRILFNASLFLPIFFSVSLPPPLLLFLKVYFELISLILNSLTPNVHTTTAAPTTTKDHSSRSAKRVNEWRTELTGDWSLLFHIARVKGREGERENGRARERIQVLNEARVSLSRACACERVPCVRVQAGERLDHSAMKVSESPFRLVDRILSSLLVLFP